MTVTITTETISTWKKINNLNFKFFSSSSSSCFSCAVSTFILMACVNFLAKKKWTRFCLFVCVLFMEIFDLLLLFLFFFLSLQQITDSGLVLKVSSNNFGPDVENASATANRRRVERCHAHLHSAFISSSAIVACHDV